MAAGFQSAMIASQWRMSRLQVVNWGTFCGYHDLKLLTEGAGTAPVTMITGESGTGKSTLLDAKTAVLMPYNVRFNAASNRTTKGRARGEDERNVYSYLLGQKDSVTDARTGESRNDYLRDLSRANWSAIVLTFESVDGRVFSASKFYYIPADSARGEYKTFHVTAERDLDPRAVESLVSEPLTARMLRTVYEGATVHDGVNAFLRAVWTKLDIGPNGEGRNAMKLHEQIQAGYSVESVDDLFKALVLDEPSTYDLAQKAVDEFDEHEEAWTRMELARQKLEVLSGIREAWSDYERQRDEVELLEGLDATSDQGVLGLWVARREAQVVGWALDDERQEMARQQARKGELELQLAQAEDAFEGLSRQFFERGGGAIDELRRDIALAQGDLVRRREQARALQRHLRRAERPDEPTAAEYAQLGKEMADFLAHEDETQAELHELRRSLERREDELGRTRDDLLAQLKHYRGQRGLMPRRMTEVRERIADLMQMELSELPFAGELMDVAREHEEWRVAANVGFHGLARTMLVDADKQRRLQVVVNGMRIPFRLHFEGVDLARDHALGRPDARMLSSKLVFDEASPFAPWLRERVREHDFVCVDSPEDLNGSEAQMTREGQERVGSKGAHGHAESSLVIGFENERLVRELEGQLSDVRRDLTACQGDLRAQARREALLGATHDLALWVGEHDYDAVDVGGALERIEELKGLLDAAEHDEALRELGALRDAKKAECDALRLELGGCDEAVRTCERFIVRFGPRHNELSEQIAGLEAAGVAVGSVQEERLEPMATEAEGSYMRGTTSSWEMLASNYGRVRDHMADRIREGLAVARRFKSTRENELSATFTRYRNAYLGDESDLGTTVDSYPDYLEILEELEHNQLSEPMDVWLADMFARVGSQLVTLGSAYNEDLRRIRGRIGPINQIMGGFSFGPEGGHLEIVQKEPRPAEIAQLRAELGEWTRYATADRGEAISPAQHAELRRFIEKLRSDLSGKKHPLLNTQRLVEMSVTVTWPASTGRDPTTFATLSAKSGGETQELVAFILGAALLYCLGDGSGTLLPSFSPVFLDEAFIKADDRHTRRAIRALTGLGFQVIIAVPTNKVQEIEPVADQYVCVTKNRSDEHSFVVPMQRG